MRFRRICRVPFETTGSNGTQTELETYKYSRYVFMLRLFFTNTYLHFPSSCDKINHSQPDNSRKGAFYEEKRHTAHRQCRDSGCAVLAGAKSYRYDSRGSESCSFGLQLQEMNMELIRWKKNRPLKYRIPMYAKSKTER